MSDATRIPQSRDSLQPSPFPSRVRANRLDAPYRWRFRSSDPPSSDPLIVRVPRCVIALFRFYDRKCHYIRAVQLMVYLVYRTIHNVSPRSYRCLLNALWHKRKRYLEIIPRYSQIPPYRQFFASPEFFWPLPTKSGSGKFIFSEGVSFRNFKFACNSCLDIPNIDTIAFII